VTRFDRLRASSDGGDAADNEKDAAGKAGAGVDGDNGAKGNSKNQSVKRDRYQRCVPPFQHKAHYSGAAGLAHFLVRTPPFARVQWNLNSQPRNDDDDDIDGGDDNNNAVNGGGGGGGGGDGGVGGRFVDPDCLFHSVSDEWRRCIGDDDDVGDDGENDDKSAANSGGSNGNDDGDADLKSGGGVGGGGAAELTPEWFAPGGGSGDAAGTFLTNASHYRFGRRSDGARVKDVVLPPWAKSVSIASQHVFSMPIITCIQSRSLHVWMHVLTCQSL
jgi:hypothetical protein